MHYNKKQVEFIGVEAGWTKKKKTCCPFNLWIKNWNFAWCNAQYVNQNTEGQIEETESISAGLDYPGVSAHYIVF